MPWPPPSTRLRIAQTSAAEQRKILLRRQSMKPIVTGWLVSMALPQVESALLLSVCRNRTLFGTVTAMLYWVEERARGAIRSRRSHGWLVWRSARWMLLALCLSSEVIQRLQALCLTTEVLLLVALMLLVWHWVWALVLLLELMETTWPTVNALEWGTRWIMMITKMNIMMGMVEREKKKKRRRRRKKMMLRMVGRMVPTICAGLGLVWVLVQGAGTGEVWEEIREICMVTQLTHILRKSLTSSVG
mmetsp:Transcript_109128/g.213811  ORF Transcript_109128/g.213811 Transcript_109128/m.213811 type:complete len:246 (+) Transcript_109128:1416-2153(+)